MRGQPCRNHRRAGINHNCERGAASIIGRNLREGLSGRNWNARPSSGPLIAWRACPRETGPNDTLISPRFACYPISAAGLCIRSRNRKTADPLDACARRAAIARGESRPRRGKAEPRAVSSFSAFSIVLCNHLTFRNVNGTGTAGFPPAAGFIGVSFSLVARFGCVGWRAR